MPVKKYRPHWYSHSPLKSRYPPRFTRIPNRVKSGSRSGNDFCIKYFSSAHAKRNIQNAIISSPAISLITKTFLCSFFICYLALPILVHPGTVLIVNRGITVFFQQICYFFANAPPCRVRSISPVEKTLLIWVLSYYSFRKRFRQKGFRRIPVRSCRELGHGPEIRFPAGCPSCK